MTIAISWERKLKGHSEIVMCSDSRLSGGGNIDVCQKIFALPREDCAIAFCGSTLLAFPIINQFISYILSFGKNMSRGIDGSELPERLCNMINEFMLSYSNPADLDRELRETSFILSYFSWKLQRPFTKRIAYEPSAREFRPIRSVFPKSISETQNSFGEFAIVGDYQHQFFRELGELVDLEKGQPLDMEPLIALCRMLSSSTFTDRSQPNRGLIGGAPQIMKIYPYMRTLEYAVYWPNKEKGELFLSGRRTFEWEKLTLPTLDADTFEIFYPMAEIESCADQ